MHDTGGAIGARRLYKLRRNAEEIITEIEIRSTIITLLKTLIVLQHIARLA